MHVSQQAALTKIRNSKKMIKMMETEMNTYNLPGDLLGRLGDILQRKNPKYKNHEILISGKSDPLKCRRGERPRLFFDMKLYELREYKTEAEGVKRDSNNNLPYKVDNVESVKRARVLWHKGFQHKEEIAEVNRQGKEKDGLRNRLQENWNRDAQIAADKKIDADLSISKIVKKMTKKQ